MLIYSGNKRQFGIDVRSGNIAEKINNLFFQRGLEHDNEREYMSWRNSLTYMYRVLDTPLFSDDIQIAIEYQIPQTSKRVDFVIAGEDNEGKSNVIVVELKQWTSALRTSRDYVVKTFTGGKERDVTHPSYQAWSYAKTIECYNEVVLENNYSIYPCAYLHNYDAEKIDQLKNDSVKDILEESPLYIKTEEEKLREFIKRYVTRPSSRNILYEIDNGRIRPSKAIQDTIGSMLKGNTEFYLIDEQKVVFETVNKLLMKALKENRKFTVIIEGGPGTGKSVVAIQLLVSMIQNGYTAQYVTKNSAPRNVYIDILKKEEYKLTYINNLFKSSGAFVNAKSNDFDCLIIDESHRLNEKSGYYGNSGVNQIMELIRASRVNVFFIDEEQIVTASDIGSVEEIKRWANKLGSYVYHNESTILTSQFRCNGSDEYISFINGLLEVKGAAARHIPDLQYDFRVFDDPSEMREALREKNQISNKSRMVAGYCYEWKSRRRGCEKQPDIILPGGFQAQWNFNNTSTWAIDETSFDQVGCIHTCQGLEFDYVGVIIGMDLQYYGGHVVTHRDKRARGDFSLKNNGKPCDDELADKIIRNTYKTLMTRGQKGCYIYCEDKALCQYIRSFLSNSKEEYHE